VYTHNRRNTNTYSVSKDNQQAQGEGAGVSGRAWQRDETPRAYALAVAHNAATALSLPTPSLCSPVEGRAAEQPVWRHPLAKGWHLPRRRERCRCAQRLGCFLPPVPWTGPRPGLQQQVVLLSRSGVRGSKQQQQQTRVMFDNQCRRHPGVLRTRTSIVAIRDTNLDSRNCTTDGGVVGPSDPIPGVGAAAAAAALVVMDGARPTATLESRRTSSPSPPSAMVTFPTLRHPPVPNATTRSPNTEAARRVVSAAGSRRLIQHPHPKN